MIKFNDFLKFTSTSSSNGGNRGTTVLGGNINSSTLKRTPISTISKPITKVNFPTKPKNGFGLSTLKNTSDLLDVKTDVRNIVDRLTKPQLEASDVEQDTSDVASQAIDLLINVVSDTYVNVPDIREIKYPKEIRGADFVGYDVDFDISWNSIDATVIRMYIELLLSMWNWVQRELLH